MNKIDLNPIDFIFDFLSTQWDLALPKTKTNAGSRARKIDSSLSESPRGHPKDIRRGSPRGNLNPNPSKTATRSPLPRTTVTTKTTGRTGTRTTPTDPGSIKKGGISPRSKDHAFRRMQRRREWRRGSLSRTR